MEKLGSHSDNEWFILMNVGSGICKSFSVPKIRSEWILIEGAFKSKTESDTKLQELCIEFRKQFYLKDESKLNLLQFEGKTSHRADLNICKSFMGERLSNEAGWNQYIGECATGVQYVCHKSNNPVGRTTTWKEGLKVRGNNIPAGTAIASFRNGVYADDHTAILIAEKPEGLEVWEQFNNPQKPWGTRTLRFKYSGSHPYSNDGNRFSVILS